MKKVLLIAGLLLLSAVNAHAFSMSDCTGSGKSVQWTSNGSWGCSVGNSTVLTFAPGLLTSLLNTKGGFTKIPFASTVTNISVSAISFSCVSNPTITLYECGSSASCATPTTIGSATLTAAGAAVNGTISSASVAAGDYVAWAISAGTCVSLGATATAQLTVN